MPVSEKLSPHLEIFRSEVPALFSILKRIFGGMFSILLVVKSIMVVLLADTFFFELNYFCRFLSGGYGLYGYSPFYNFAGLYLDGTILLSEFPGIFSFIGVAGYVLDILLILSASFYLVTFLVYKEDVRLGIYHATVVSMPVIVLLILLLTYLNIKVWL